MGKKFWFGVISVLSVGVFIAASRMARTDTYTPVLPFPDNSFCNSPIDSAVLMNDAGPVLTPQVAAANRRYVVVTNSKENAGAPVIKCGIAPQPTWLDAGCTTVDAGWATVPGVCYHDGGPSCGSTNTYNGDLDGGPLLADAGCQQQVLVDGGPDCPYWVFGIQFDGGPCLVDGGGYDAGFSSSSSCPLVDAGALLDGGFIDAGYTACVANCVQSWKLTGKQNPPIDGGFTFSDGGPCLADAGFCLLDGGQLILDGGPVVTDAGYIYQDGGPYLGSTMPGDALNKGDSITYPVGPGQGILCIGTNGLPASAAVKECR